MRTAQISPRAVASKAFKQIMKTQGRARLIHQIQSFGEKKMSNFVLFLFFLLWFVHSQQKLRKFHFGEIGV
jgi:hypothetical protein